MAIASTSKEQVLADKLRRFANSVAVFNQHPLYTTPLPAEKANMPAAYRPQSLPLTPPEYFPAYAGCGGVQLNSMQFAIGHQTQEKGVFKGMYGPHDYMQHSSFVASNVQAYHSSQDHSGQYGPSGHPGRLYSNAGSSMELPGLIEDGPKRHQHHQSQRQEAVEERPVGGVSAHLDYDMEEMSEFVAMVSHNIVQPNVALPSPFRKFVSQILSSTRLPSSTILLGMEYLSSRMKQLPGSHWSSSGHAYRMLTIALLLASKFLDDNTFQNKSWAEVTGLPVTELNTLELEWLSGIGWHLHVDPTGKKGFEIWKQTWDNWRTANSAPKPTERPMSQVNANIAHRRSIHSNFSPLAMYPSGMMTDRTIQLPLPQPQQSQSDSTPGYWWPASVENSPPSSAPETGPATPDFSFGNWGMQFAPPALPTPGHHGQQMPYPLRIPSISLPPLAMYSHHHHQQIWPGGSTCGCGHCARGDYFTHNFGQTVVG